MSIKIALAGNPNSGKTTMFNVLTGSSQYVGNWPGVTVEKKEGRLKGDKEVIIQDLPGIYSLSPYTLEEVIAREYLVSERPDAIINIVDGTNIERNLYLTTQLLELNIPMVIAVNMIDVVRRNGDIINLQKLSYALGCPVVETSALKGEGSIDVAKLAIDAAKVDNQEDHAHVFQGATEHALAHIEESIQDKVDSKFLRWYSVKLFERDEKVIESLSISEDLYNHINAHIEDCEKELDDDAESIITNQRYAYISNLIDRTVKKKHSGVKLNVSDKIDRVVTHRIYALPIFALAMFVVYYLSITTVGTLLTDFTNEILFGEWIPPLVQGWLEAMGVADWLVGLVVDGIIAGVGAVLGFVPQMLVLFLLLSILEDVGYMARVAFIMDRVFRKLGLSGKSFIPMLIGSGCSVPGIMASRTIEQEKDRRMTVMTTSFIPCGAKLPIIAMFAGALFNDSGWVATSCYFIGVIAVIITGVMLKKTKFFAGDPAPFVMELPPYHAPAPTNVLRSTWERGWSFIKRAGSVILVSSIILWFLQAFGMVDGTIQMVEDNNTSILAAIGGVVAPIFAPLGFGTWQATVGTVTGLIAKENVVGTFGVLYGYAEISENGEEIWSNLRGDFTTLTAYSFMVFNLLCAPCFAAIGAIKREMNNAKWTWFTVGYQTVFAYVISLIVYQIGMVVAGNPVGIGFVIAVILSITIIYLLLRPNKYEGTGNNLSSVEMNGR